MFNFAKSLKTTIKTNHGSLSDEAYTHAYTDK